MPHSVASVANKIGIHRSTLYRWMKKKKTLRSGRKSKLNGTEEKNIINTAINNKGTSQRRQLATLFGVSQSTIHRTLRRHRISRAYKIRTLYFPISEQRFLENRLAFKARVHRSMIKSKDIAFTDESNACSQLNQEFQK